MGEGGGEGGGGNGNKEAADFKYKQLERVVKNKYYLKNINEKVFLYNCGCLFSHER